jgi:hypothetical protein
VVRRKKPFVYQERSLLASITRSHLTNVEMTSRSTRRARATRCAVQEPPSALRARGLLHRTQVQMTAAPVDH